MIKTIGILGMHGSREEHAAMMESLEYKTVLLREKEDYKNISGMILPGGESTSFGRLLEWTDTKKIFEQKILEEHLPVFGTCAGAILLSQKGSEYGINAIDIDVNRNAYGRQTESFSEDIVIKGIENNFQKFHAIFIRAPQINRIGKDLIVLAEYKNMPILVQDTTKNTLVSTFHPELTTDNRIHKIFADMVENHRVC